MVVVMLLQRKSLVELMVSPCDYGFFFWDLHYHGLVQWMDEWMGGVPSLLSFVHTHSVICLHLLCFPLG